MKKTLLFILATAFLPSLKADLQVYVSNQRDKNIGWYQLDAKSGELTHKENINIKVGPGGMGISPDKKFLYVASRAEKKKSQITVLAVNQSTGALNIESSTPTLGFPSFVKIDKTGKYLFTSYYGEGQIAVHAIKPNGSLQRKAVQSMKTAEKAHAILLDPGNQFVFVPHTGPNKIFQFVLDQENGKLTPNNIPSVQPEEGLEPRHLFFHQNIDFAYAINEAAGSVTTYRFDSAKGTLDPIQTLSSLPDGFSARNKSADIEIHPSGEFLYASNRGHDSIAAYTIDPETGKLTALGQTKTGTQPRSFNIDPTGKFLVAAGQKSNDLTVYRINQETGKLKELKKYKTGKFPSWVEIVQL